MEGHLSTSRHRRKKRILREQEAEQRIEIFNRENIHRKGVEIISGLQEHPMFLKWEWQPLGHFLKIFKKTRFEELSFQEFLVSRDIDEDEVIMEALDWLDLYFGAS